MSNEKSFIGEKIKLLRQKAGVLPEDLAPILDLPGAILAKIENGVIEPTVATLLKCSQYFDVSMESFFSDDPLDKPLQIVRAEEHDQVERKRASGDTPASYRYHALAPNLKAKNMQPFFITLDPATKEDLPTLSHEGEEFIYVLEGNIDFHADKEVLNLRPGDSIYFHSEIPHALYGKGAGKSTAVVVVYAKQKKK
jgi:quercetin dioxygenase-like cupin family protein